MPGPVLNQTNERPTNLTIPTENHNNNQSNSSHLSDGPSNRVDLINSQHGRILCIADIRGRLSQINELAKEFNATAVIHSGDFGFYEPTSLERISDRTLRHLIQYSSLITPQFRSQLLAPNMNVHSIRQMISNPPTTILQDSNLADFPLSEFPDLLSGKLKFDVPVYTIWGACEDVAILEKIRAAGPSPIKLPNTEHFENTTSLSNYSIINLTVLDEATTRCLIIGGVRLRLFGLGGAIVPHKLFDNGEGGATIAGGQGTMWTTVLQVGEVVDTAQRVYDPTETRLLVSHASPGREGLLAQLALVLKADLTISAGLHFRYGVSYNEFSVQHDQESFRAKLHQAKLTFNEIWDTVKGQVNSVIDEHQRQLLSNALAVANRVPASAQPGGGGATTEEAAWKNSWNWNLPDAAFGSLILDIKEGRIGAEMRSQGFNFAYRATSPQQQQRTTTTAAATNPVSTSSNSVANPGTLSSSISNNLTSPASATTNIPNQTNLTKPSFEPQVTPKPEVPIVTATGKSHVSQGSGSGLNNNQPNTSRSSMTAQSNRHHLTTKSREDIKDNLITTNHSPRPSVETTKPITTTAPSINGGLSKPITTTNPKPNPTTVVQEEDSIQPTASTSSSRKSSIANRKKKASSNSAKSDGTTAEKSDTASTDPTRMIKTSNEPKETGLRAIETSKSTNGTPSDPNQILPLNSTGGGQYKYNRGSMRGSRGGPNNYNNHNNRGNNRGRGGGRGGDNRPSGPGLVGPALAGAGIGNRNNNTPSNNSA
ncbi:hypothetical protein CROQUDRAFT_132200 [Cronartium quercuum f. sp. fusiforme G11]|uniref:DUF2433 domain-containing protein n=1 Tax=Cronartium quercuum f. sp. fusiforme G11 TaxID=708437 RepID=A0A9P6TCY7_9BASI|nr:hypothetical protein CROQUDRAFT_132200 [Cronartium quercuum f. sp. fusiforme G11]